MLKIGECVPDVGGVSTMGRRIALREFRGKPLVVYFFLSTHRASIGCHQQAQRFRDNYPEIRQLGADVIGISVDPVDLTCRFALGYQVTFPLIADQDHSCSLAFGVLRRFPQIDKRVTFILNERGVVDAVFHHEFQVSRHLDDVLNHLRKRSGARGASGAGGDCAAEIGA